MDIIRSHFTVQTSVYSARCVICFPVKAQEKNTVIKYDMPFVYFGICNCSVFTLLTAGIFIVWYMNLYLSRQHVLLIMRQSWFWSFDKTGILLENAFINCFVSIVTIYVATELFFSVGTQNVENIQASRLEVNWKLIRH